MKASAIEKLVGRLNTQSDHAAEQVIRSLAKVAAAARPLLLKAVRDEGTPERIRKWSYLALGSIGGSGAYAALLEGLSHERMSVRLLALKGLRRMGASRAAPRIAKLLGDPSGGVRVNALYALMELGGKKQSPAVLKALSDPQWYVRQNACLACGKLGLKSASARLQRLEKKDEKKAVRLAAGTALKELGLS